MSEEQPIQQEQPVQPEPAGQPEEEMQESVLPEQQASEERRGQYAGRQFSESGEPAQQRPRFPDKPDNMIYVGRKNVMSYVLAVVTQFNSGASEVRLKARGKSISCAVDASQIIKHRFIPSLQIKDVRLSTEELMSEDGTTSRVSSMEILMTK